MTDRGKLIELLYNLPTPEPVIGIRAGEVNYGWLYCRPPAILKDPKANCLVYCRLEDVKEK